MSQGDMCPYCLEMGAIVKDTRPDEYGRRRRKECPSCGKRWSTHEVNHELVQAMSLIQERILQYAHVFTELQQLVEMLRPSKGEKGDRRKDLLQELADKYREEYDHNHNYPNADVDEEPPIKFIAEDNAFGKSLQGAHKQLLHQRTDPKRKLGGGKVPRR